MPNLEVSPNSQLTLIANLEAELREKIREARLTIHGAEHQLAVLESIKAKLPQHSDFCTNCFGNGKTQKQDFYGHDSNEWQYVHVECPQCAGTGLKSSAKMPPPAG